LQFVESNPPLEELELELEVEVQEPLEVDELLLEVELPEELLVEELEVLVEELLEEELLEPSPIEPAEAVRITQSSLEPSSRRTMRSVCAPAARLLKVAGVSVA
jgi:hypothetical protein